MGVFQTARINKKTQTFFMLKLKRNTALFLIFKSITFDPAKIDSMQSYAAKENLGDM